MTNRKDYLVFLVMKLLMEGKRITHPDFQKISNSWRLASVIHYLRTRYKWHISDRWVGHPPARRGIKQYFLQPEEINRLTNLRTETLEKSAVRIKSEEF